MLWPRSRMVSFAEWLDLSLDDLQHERLERFGTWLTSEARVAGGIGPDETPRVFDRHVADSLAFLAAFEGARPATIVDVGSGVGLPGIPLAIACPESLVTLSDRSGRRTDLARRAMRILQLDNVEVRQTDVADLTLRFEAAVFRASLTPVEARTVVPGLVQPGGMAVIALSRARSEPPIPDDAAGVESELVEVAAPMLDSPAWLLRMRLASA